MNDLENSPDSGDRSTQNLLIVDDKPDVVKTLIRYAKRVANFQNIYGVHDRLGAIGVLKEHHITHVICDWDLGDKDTGEKLIKDWRIQLPYIKRAIILTGASSEINLSQQDLQAIKVDAVVDKATDLKTIFETLLGYEEILFREAVLDDL